MNKQLFLGRKLILLLLSVFSFTFFNGCSKGHDLHPAHKVSEQMVLVYIAANNNLQADAINSIKKMQNGFVAKDGRKLLVYTKTSYGASFLLDIKPSKSNKIVADTLIRYQGQNSSDPDFFKRVISDSRRLYPANSYGLVLWSHATSWAPPANPRKKTKSFGYDNEQEMDIKDLRNALPDDLEYLVFDACSMASIEVCFELKEKAKYILASPTEILSSSFPYDEVANDFFDGLSGLKLIAKKFINYYKQQPGLYASATISLIDTKALADIAHQSSALLALGVPMAPFNKSAVQQLDFEKGSGVVAYDFISFLKHNYQKEVYAALENSINKAVLYQDTTGSFFGIPIVDFCGLSVYLPEQSDPYKSYYNALLWSQKSSWNKMFN